MKWKVKQESEKARHNQIFKIYSVLVKPQHLYPFFKFFLKILLQFDKDYNQIIFLGLTIQNLVGFAWAY